MYLLDTNVVAELRRQRPHGAVLTWLESIGDTVLHISAFTIGEIQAGIEITREQDQAKAAEFEAWLEVVSQTYRILNMDAAIFRFWARLMHRRSNELMGDAMIAATAAVHDLTVVTRNVKDFETLGASTLNPFQRRER